MAPAGGSRSWPHATVRFEPKLRSGLFVHAFWIRA
jgi:uncharacterized protein (DUF1015 family)